MIRTSLHKVMFFCCDNKKIAPCPDRDESPRARGREFERQGARMRVGACPSVGFIVTSPPKRIKMLYEFDAFRSEFEKSINAAVKDDSPDPMALAASYISLDVSKRGRSTIF